MKKSLSLLLSLIMLLSTISGINFTAKAVENPYPPYNYYNSSTDYQIACTWYAWEQAKNRGIIISETSWQNAGNWYYAAPYQKGSEPRINSIACWASVNGDYGHVAYVTGVNSDGSIEITEGGSNWEGNVHGVKNRTVYRDKYWPTLGFIYLKCAVHSWDGGVVTTQPTCIKDGVKTFTCTVCKETKTETVPKGEKYHKYKTIGTVKATLTTNGVLGKECKICKKQVKSYIYHPSKYSADTPKYIYDGKAKKPKVTVKDTKGNVIPEKYYTLSYVDNKNVGTAKAKIKFKGRYSGTASAKFKIFPKGTKIKKYDYNKTKKTVKVTWAKQATQTSGYRFQYSTNKEFKNAKTVLIKDKSKTSVTIKSIKPDTVYYFRIQTYKSKNNGKEKYYSSWADSRLSTFPISLNPYIKSQCEYHKHPSSAVVGEKAYGNYYYTVSGAGKNNQYDYIYRKSGKKSLRIAAVNHSTGYIQEKIITDGITVFYAVSKAYGNGYIYKADADGKNKKLLLKQKGISQVTGKFGNCIYYLKQEWDKDGLLSNVRFCKYDFVEKKAYTIYNNALDMANNLDTNGRYMIFASYSQDWENVNLTLYDAKTNTKKVFAKGWDAGFSKNSIYYTTVNTKYIEEYDYMTYESFNILRCDYNGNNKQTIKQNISSDYYTLFISKTGVYMFKNSTSKYVIYKFK